MNSITAPLDIKAEDWEFELQQRNEHPILMADFWCRSLYTQFREEINLPVSKLDYLFTNTNRGYVKRKQKSKVLNAIKKAAGRETYLKYVFQGTQARMAEFELAADGILKKIRNGKVSREEIVILWEVFDEVFSKIIPWFWIPWYITEGNLLSDKVKERLLIHRKIVEPITDFNNALMVLLFPTQKVLFQKEQDDFFRLVQVAGKKKRFEQDATFLRKAEHYLHVYAWTKTFLLLPIEPLSRRELLRKVKSALKGKFIAEYHLQKKQQRKNQRLAKQLIQQLHADKALLAHIAWARKYGWLLTWSVEQALITTARLQPFFRLIAKETKIPYPQWILLTSEEIAGTLKGTFHITKRNLKKRRTGYVFLMERGKGKLVVGRKAQQLSRWIDTNIGKQESEVDTLTGQPVSPGVVRGRVRISLLARDAHAIREGEVLVCSMTSPEYVPAMKRSGAVITDEGGLLSHAAIVARELNKPCIVGTKIATKVLKDGDLVEVDANEGVVRKLKK